MAQTNFAYIQEEAESAIDREARTPTLSAVAQANVRAAREVVIAGFALNDEEASQRAHEDGRTARLEAIRRYRASRDGAIHKLAEYDITPLAVLPKTAWQKICKDSGLIRVSPSKEGSVKISTAILHVFKQTANIIAVRSLLGLIALIGCVAAAILRYFLAPFPIQIVAAFTASLVTAFIIFVWCEADKSSGLENRFLRLQINRFAKRSWPTIVEAFFPDETESPDNNIWIESATIILPEPPVEVARILCKAHSLDLKVALVPEAFRLVESPRDILLRQHARQVAAERQHLEALRRDPIIYIENGSAVAIIAQFGDFPVEKEVVDRVMNSEYLI